MYVADTLAALARFGPKLAQLYGQGESPMTITHLSREDHSRHELLGTAGVADSCVEVQVVDENDNPLPVGEAGEIVCRGDTVMAGYWDNAEATAETLRGGWLHTGDLGVFDAAGYLTLTGRSKDLIISGGANVYPREVEEVLVRAPGVAEACVIGRPDPDWGEVVIAYVVAEPGANAGSRKRSTASASSTWPASSAPRPTASSPTSPRTPTARSSRPNSGRWRWP
jgi:long-chain acyl-CoA synthetase